MRHVHRIAVLFTIGIILFSGRLYGQVWKADNGDGTYNNPIIYADYSDPDVIRVGADYYMVASSFTCFPGIPVLHSKDLVNWTIVNHVYTSLPFDRYKKPAHGQGSWAPSIRYHNGLYYIYFCTPEEGLFMASTDHPAHKWTLHHVLNVAQWEDPCPLWDDDGKAYLVRGKLCGGPMYIHQMSPDGTKILDDGKIIYWNDQENPTLEGFKTMKKDGWYYIFAPAGGVPTGWQTVLRSKNIYGPYEQKRVLEANNNGINGPHQGGLVETSTGEWWFIHFQDKGIVGRVALLQPAAWKNDWPVIGEDADGDGCGYPVLRHKKPNVGKTYPIAEPQNSDEFNSPKLGLQWQWHAIPQAGWYSLTANKGAIRLYAVSNPTELGNLHYVGNQLLQKFPAPAFSVETKIDVSGLADGERAGLVVQGAKHFYIAIDKTDKGKTVSVYEGRKENCGFPPNPLTTTEISSNVVWLKVQVFQSQKYKFAYSLDGVQFTEIDQLFEATKGVWIGAKVGLFCISPSVKKGKGFIDADYFRVQGGVLASPQAQAVQTSGNPVFEGWYADPEAIVYGDTYWIYPTWSVAFDKQTFFDCFSSKDLITWTKHASIIDTTEVKWAKKALWAPSVIQKGDKYYFFFGANCLLKDSETGGIGVAVSDRPEGPYKDLLGKPLIGKIVNGAQPIDQFVFRDGDAYYMYYGGWGHCNLVKLSDDFTSLVPFEDGTTFKEITPKSYVEGPFMFKRNGKYYFMWSEGGWTGPDYSVAYSISDSPFGPFERIGKILQQDVTVATGAGHHSVIHIPDSDDYYIVYHRHPLGDNDGNHRVTCIDKMTFDEKGFINPVKMTSEGVEAKIISTNNK